MLQPLSGGLTPLGVGRGSRNYSAKVLAVAPANLMAYWKLDETSGTVAADSSGNNRSGVFSGATPGAATFADGSPAASFNGVDNFVNAYSAALNTAAQAAGSAGTVLAWVRVHDSSVWSSGVERFIISLRSTTGFINISVRGQNSAVRFLYPGVASYDLSTSTTDWFSVGLTWDASANEQKCYFNGAQVGTTKTGITSFWAALYSYYNVIGASNAYGPGSFDGSAAHAALWTRALSAAELAAVMVT